MEPSTAQETISASATVLRLTAIVLLVALNGFFVAAEFAIVRVRATRVKALARRGSHIAIIAEHMLGHLNAYLSATQLGITIASILLGWVGESTLRVSIIGPAFKALNITNPAMLHVVSFLFGTGLIVFLHVVLGEQAPKALAIQFPEITTMWIAYPLKWFYYLLYPIITVLNNASLLMLRLVGIQPATEHDMGHTEEELRMLFSASTRSGALTTEKRVLLENVFDLSQRIVRQIMVPRTRVAAFNLQKTLADNMRIAALTAHSRYPLIDGDLDHAVGLIHMKDLFWQLKEMEAPHPPLSAEGGEDTGGAAPDDLNPMISGGDVALNQPATGAEFLRKIAREVPYVPETMRIDNLLRELQQKHVHLAMVVDEYGGTSGLVTFENVIEEIVGEVQDEFDQETPLIRRINDTEFAIDGFAPLTEVNDALGCDLRAEDADTIGGYILAELGRMPVTGDRLSAEGIELTVSEMQRHGIQRIHARLLGQAAPGDEHGEHGEHGRTRTNTDKHREP
ncbi:MAG: hemolysin family protein [bacterium]